MIANLALKRNIVGRTALATAIATLMLSGATPASASSPGTPAFCQAFGQTTQFVSIDGRIPPDTPFAFASVITVPPTSHVIADVDIVTSIKHEKPIDLDITVTSPAGTVVTLSTGNGWEHPDVFNGTLWDDDANPGGALPHGANPGVVTDHPYQDGVVATTLTPEEPLGALIGENPSGQWTLFVTDYTVGGGGDVVSWELRLTTYPVAPTVSSARTFTQTADYAVAPGAVVTSTVVVSGVDDGYLADVDVDTFLRHPSPGKVSATLTSPAGTVVTLTTRNGNAQDDVFNGTHWDDSAGPPGSSQFPTDTGLASGHPYTNNVVATPLVPEEPLAAFIGEDPNGTWTLTVADDGSLNGGALDGFSITMKTTEGCIRRITGTVTTPVVARDGELVVIQNARITAPVTAQHGSLLVVDASTLAAGLTADRPRSMAVCGTRISPASGGTALSLDGTFGPVALGSPAISCAANTISGNVTVSNAADVVTIAGNRIGGTLACSGNFPAPYNAGQRNTAATKTGQCAAL